MTHLVLNEHRIPAGFEQVRGIGPSERVEIETGREVEIVTVAAEPPDECGFRDEISAFAGEQVDPVVHMGLTILQPVDQHFGRPVEDCQHAAPLRRGALLRFAVTHMNKAELSELLRVGVPCEVNRLQVGQFVEPQPIRVGNLEHHGVAVCGQPTLSAGSYDGRYLLVGMIEEVLKFTLGECALFGLGLVLLDVSSGVPVEEDLGWVSPEQCFADAVPPVVRIADIGTELSQADLIRTDRRLDEFVDTAKIAEELVDHGDGPGPWKLVRVLDEALHLLDAGVDSLELQIAAELLVAPALKHFGDCLFFGVQGPDRVNEICTSDVVDCHSKLLPSGINR